MEHHGLAGQVSCVVVSRESDIDVLLLTGGHAHDLLFEAGNKGAAAQLQFEIVALAAFESDAVVKALEIDVGGVAHFGSLLHYLGGSNVLSHTVQLGFNLSIGNLNGSLFHFQTLVLAQSDLGVHIGGQNQRDDVLLADLHIGQAGTADSLHVLFHNGVLIDLGKNFFQTVFVENMSTVHGLNHLPGSLAFTEAGDHDLLTGLHVSGIDTLLHQLLVDLDGDGSLIAVSFNVLHIHGLLSS